MKAVEAVVALRDQGNLLRRVTKAVREVLPQAQVILYGSRARGDARPDSDYDLLVLMEEAGTVAVEEAIRNRLYPIELETVAVLTVHRSNFEQSGFVASPDPADLARLAQDHGVPYVYDVGSGLLADLSVGVWREYGHKLVELQPAIQGDLSVLSRLSKESSRTHVRKSVEEVIKNIDARMQA